MLHRLILLKSVIFDRNKYRQNSLATNPFRCLITNDFSSISLELSLNRIKILA